MALLLCAPAAPLVHADRGAPADAANTPPTVEAWVRLSLPELARVPAAQRSAALELIERQQDDVMRQLAALGAVEHARVHIVRNALAVRIPVAALAQARLIDGVLAVTPVRHRDIHRP
ncbi:MAG TPA: hypothetical protein VGE16_14875 [Albitalea sp.]